jgi:TolB protein
VTRVVALLIGAALCASAAAAGTAPGGRIVFASESGVQARVQVWLMKPDGSGRHALTPRSIDAETPALSPDGRRIAFVRRNDIYVMRVDGSATRRLTLSSATEGAPTWSPDGRWIAYSRYRASNSDIWKMRADGSAKRRLTRTGRKAAEDVPDWSPSGTRIAYAGRDNRIWVMNADGGGQRPVTKTASGRGLDWAPAWAPGGRRIAYESNVATSATNPTNEIWLVDADAPSRSLRLTHNALQDMQPDWSPGGRWLVFASAKPHPGRLHLWLMRPSGKGLHRATAWRGEQYWPSWAR